MRIMVDDGPYMINLIRSCKWIRTTRADEVLLRVYVQQNLTITHHRQVVDAIWNLTEEGGLPITELREPKLNMFRHGMHWQARATIDTTLLPEPTHDPKDLATTHQRFGVAVKEKGWTEGTM